MITSEVIEYIKQQKNLGVQNEAIKANMMSIRVGFELYYDLSGRKYEGGCIDPSVKANLSSVGDLAPDKQYICKDTMQTLAAQALYNETFLPVCVDSTGCVGEKSIIGNEEIGYFCGK